MSLNELGTNTVKIVDEQISVKPSTKITIIHGNIIQIKIIEIIKIVNFITPKENEKAKHEDTTRQIRNYE